MMTAAARRSAKSARTISEHIPSRLFVVAEVSVDNVLNGVLLATTNADDAYTEAHNAECALNDYASYPRVIAVELTDEQRRAIQDTLGAR